MLEHRNKRRYTYLYSDPLPASQQKGKHCKSKTFFCQKKDFEKHSLPPNFSVNSWRTELLCWLMSTTVAPLQSAFPPPLRLSASSARCHSNSERMLPPHSLSCFQAFQSRTGNFTLQEKKPGDITNLQPHVFWQKKRNWVYKSDKHLYWTVSEFTSLVLWFFRQLMAIISL